MSEWDLAEIDRDSDLFDRDTCHKCNGLGFDDNAIDCDDCDGKGYYDTGL